MSLYRKGQRHRTRHQPFRRRVHGGLRRHVPYGVPLRVVQMKDRKRRQDRHHFEILKPCREGFEIFLGERIRVRIRPPRFEGVPLGMGPYRRQRRQLRIHPRERR